MQLIYEGVDITDKVEMSGAVTTDNGGGTSDMIELSLYNAADWLRWGPATDDHIEIIDTGYRTGAMYIDTLLPDGDIYKLRAYSMPLRAREKRWSSYERVTLYELVSIVAAEMGMDVAFYGVNQDEQYPFLLRRNEAAPAFLQRILALEGATLKCCDGKLVAVDILWAQERAPVCELELAADMAGAKHNKTQGRGYSCCEVKSPFGSGTANDTASLGTGTLLITNEPTWNDVQAARWARGALLSENRGNEKLTWKLDFTPSMTGLVRVDISAPGEIGGAWILDQVKHDHIERKSDCTFLRCLNSIV